VISDTVGFVSDLPTHLVAAFRATLEEVLEADLIVHVRDIAHPDSERQRADVEEVLTRSARSRRGRRADDRGAEQDRCPAARAAPHPAGRTASARADAPVPGLGAERGGRRASCSRRSRICWPAARRARSTVPLSDGATIAWLYRHGEVRSRHDDGEVARLTVALDAAASPSSSAGRRRALTPRRPLPISGAIPDKETP
jgi:GTP-binding protein HflX